MSLRAGVELAIAALLFILGAWAVSAVYDAGKAHEELRHKADVAEADRRVADEEDRGRKILEEANRAHAAAIEALQKVRADTPERTGVVVRESTPAPGGCTRAGAAGANPGADAGAATAGVVPAGARRAPEGGGFRDAGPGLYALADRADDLALQVSSLLALVRACPAYHF